MSEICEKCGAVREFILNPKLVKDPNAILEFPEPRGHWDHYPNSVECLEYQLKMAKKYLLMFISGNSLSPEWKTPKDFYDEIKEFLKS